MTQPQIVGQPHRAERVLFQPAALVELDKQTQALAAQLVEQTVTAAAAQPAVQDAARRGTSGPATLPPQSDRFADYSSNNPRPRLPVYKAVGRTSVAIKATEGAAYTFTIGNEDHSTAHALGLTVDRYHWTRPDQGSAVLQARHFWDSTKTLWRAGDGAFPDWETSYDYSTGRPVQDPPDRAWAQFLLEFVAEFRRLADAALSFHLPVRLYTGNWYLDGKPAMQAAARQFGVILSDYSGVLPVNNRYQLTLAAHQYNNRETVAGFAAPLDDNYRIDWAGGSGPKPPQPPADLLEQIVALNRNSPDYKQFMADVETASAAGAAQALGAIPGPGGHKHPFWWMITHPAQLRAWSGAGKPAKPSRGGKL